MILKILLLIIFFQLFLECFREGMIGQESEVEKETPFNLEDIVLSKDCPYNDNRNNIKYPYYNQTLNTYTNKNNFLNNNYENILKYATTPCN